MKRENCVQVKNVNKLSKAYLLRFFGSVGPVASIEKDQISKYVTIQFVHRSSVDKVFRYQGRVLDERPIKIRKLKQSQLPLAPATIQNEGPIKQKSSLQLRDQSFTSNGSQQELFLLIRDEIMPHHLQQNQRLIIAILIWRLADQLSTDIKHLKHYKVNMRSSYLKLELQREIIDRINRKNNKNIVTMPQSLKSVVIQTNDSEALVWYTVAYPNSQQEQCKVEAGSLFGKCVSTIRSQLSIRIADSLSSLYAASLCFNLQESPVDKILNLNTNLTTSNDDNFQGIIENIGSKDVFFDLLNYEVANSCVKLRQSKILQCFQCTLRLQCPPLSELKEQNWCNFYRGQLCRKLNAAKQQIFYTKNNYKIQNIKLGAQTLAFESCQFSLLRMGKQIARFKEIFEDNSNIQVVYIMKQNKPEKVFQFKKSYEDPAIQIQNQIDQVSHEKQITDNKTDNKTQQFQEIKLNQQFISWANIIEIKYQGYADCNFCKYLVVREKLSHYLINYIEEYVISKGLIIASKQMSYKLAMNIIQRQKEGRLFDFAQRKYEKYIGDQLWRLYQNRSQIKAKSIVAKYTKK